MNTTGAPDILQILKTFYRHRGIIIAAFFVVTLLAGYLAMMLPNIYRSSSLIVVTPQRVPATFVTSTVTMELRERIQSIIQEILSRTQLVKVAQEFDLYSNSTASSDDRVDKLRKSIKIDVRVPQARGADGAVFELSFESENAQTAQQVTNRLAALFIEQNLQVREQQAVGTKAFISAEAERLRKELEQQEGVVNRYKAAHLYELPDQLDANLRNLEQLRRELEASNLRLTSLQERRGNLQKQSVETDSLRVDLLNPPVGGLGGTEGLINRNVQLDPVLQLELKQKELASMQQRYSEKHPDVVRLVREIELLQSEVKHIGSSTPENASKVTALTPVRQVLQVQIADLDSEISTLRSYQERVRGQIRQLESRVDTAPIRAIELTKITRGYEITLKKYQDLLAKNLESELSQNMEKNFKGEQFQILDAANLPLYPVRPNRRMILFVGILAGLGIGFVLAFLRDNFGTAFRTADDISAYVSVPLLVTVPALLTRGSVLEQRRSQGLLVLTSIGVLIVGVLLLRTFGPRYF